MAKRSNLISFKAGEDLLDLLESLRVGDESLSLTVKRLTEEQVGLAKPKTPIEEQVEAASQKLDQVLEKLESLGKKCPQEA